MIWQFRHQKVKPQVKLVSGKTFDIFILHLYFGLCNRGNLHTKHICSLLLTLKNNEKKVFLNMYLTTTLIVAFRCFAIRAKFHHLLLITCHQPVQACAFGCSDGLNKYCSACLYRWAYYTKIKFFCLCSFFIYPISLIQNTFLSMVF